MFCEKLVFHLFTLTLHVPLPFKKEPTPKILSDHQILQAFHNVYNDVILTLEGVTVVSLRWALLDDQEEVIVVFVTDWNGARRIEARLTATFAGKRVYVVRERLVNLVDENYVEPLVVRARASGAGMTSGVLLKDNEQIYMLQCAHDYMAKGFIAEAVNEVELKASRCEEEKKQQYLSRKLELTSVVTPEGNVKTYSDPERIPFMSIGKVAEISTKELDSALIKIRVPLQEEFNRYILNPPNTLRPKNIKLVPLSGIFNNNSRRIVDYGDSSSPVFDCAGVFHGHISSMFETADIGFMIIWTDVKEWLGGLGYNLTLA
ncbi:hypothetical protein K440DRAFT_644019 [Wilcoxina mikolae CBS 423.85]|nr:hypothetical protein K440DRAFT_644019 [Wilcoxina mikolae CBS 423.85]